MDVSAGGAADFSRASRPLFYCITDRQTLARPTTDALLDQLQYVISRGVDFVQLREKDLPDRELFELTRRAVRLARGSACRILVNGRLDVAVAGGAHGLHLPSTGIEAADIKSFLPEDFILGVSTHSLAEARSAAARGASYLLFGPVYPTPSKAEYGKPPGLNGLREVCANVPIPVFGLGGIQGNVIREVLGAGASGIAGISLFQKNLDSLCREDFRG